MKTVARILARQLIATIRSYTVILVSMDIGASVVIENSTKYVNHRLDVGNAANAFVLVALSLEACKCELK